MSPRSGTCSSHSSPLSNPTNQQLPYTTCATADSSLMVGPKLRPSQKQMTSPSLPVYSASPNTASIAGDKSAPSPGSLSPHSSESSKVPVHSEQTPTVLRKSHSRGHSRNNSETFYAPLSVLQLPEEQPVAPGTVVLTSSPSPAPFSAFLSTKEVLSSTGVSVPSSLSLDFGSDPAQDTDDIVIIIMPLKK